MNYFVTTAQQKHFIYVQSEDKQPFAIVLKGKVYSSSDYGYIIVPKLADGDYTFTVSFPMNKFPDQAFACSINKKDAGFFLKNSNDGWALQDMQTQKIIMNSTATVAQKNAFGDMLSEVVSDSSLTKTNVEEAPVAASTGIVATDIAATNDHGFITDSIAPLEKISESQLDTGTNMVFVDQTQSGTDTISVFIPSETRDTGLAEITRPAETGNETNNQQDSGAIASLQNNNAVTENKDAPASKGDVPENTVPEAVTEKTKEDVSNPFYKPEQNNNTAANQASTALSAASLPGITSAVKQDCDKMLSDEELNKLKRKMFVQDDDNGMVQYAVKFINKKCLSTDQVKSIGTLFSSDDGRYSLYDALYKYVYDYGNYPSLASQILDPYYKKRFAALLR